VLVVGVPVITSVVRSCDQALWWYPLRSHPPVATPPNGHTAEWSHGVCARSLYETPKVRPYGETPRPCSETLSSDPRRNSCSLAVATHHAPAISLTIPAKLRHAGAPLGRRPITPIGALERNAQRRLRAWICRSEPHLSPRSPSCLVQRRQGCPAEHFGQCKPRELAEELPAARVGVLGSAGSVARIDRSSGRTLLS